MSTTTVLRSRRADQRALRPGPAQLALAFASIAGAVLLVVFIHRVATVEAATVAFWLGPLVFDGVIPIQEHFVVVVDGVPVGFKVTASCSAAVLLAPAMVMYAVILFIRRVSMVRALAALVAMVATIFVTNQLRLGLIGWASQVWGLDLGYEITHRYVGSALAIIGFSLGVALLFLLTRSNGGSDRVRTAAA